MTNTIEDKKQRRRASGRKSYAKHRQKRLAARRLKPKIKRAYKPTDPKRRFANYIKSVYGLTVEAYEKFLADQRGCCAICGKHAALSCHGRLYVDHSHKTGAVRGLLCNNCNAGLGSFQDDAHILIHALGYLRQSDG